MGFELEQSFQHVALPVTAFLPCLCKPKAKHIHAWVHVFAGDLEKGAHHISSSGAGEFMTARTVYARPEQGAKQ
jgi:hypothetical protein